METDLEPFQEEGRQLSEFGANAVDVLSELVEPSEFSEYELTSDAMYSRFESLDDTLLKDTDDPHEDFLVVLDEGDDAWSVLPTEWREPIGRLSGNLDGYVTCMKPATENEETIVIYETEFSPRKTVRRWWVSVRLSSQTQTAEMTLKYGTSGQVHRLEPVQNEINVFDRTPLPIGDDELSGAQEKASVFPIVDEHARNIAFRTLASYKSTLVTLLEQQGFSHTRIAEMTDTTRSTVSTQASRFNDLSERVEEKRKEVENTESLLGASSSQALEEFSNSLRE